MIKQILVTLFFLVFVLALATAVSAQEGSIVRKTVIVQKGRESFTVIDDKKSVEIMKNFFPHGRIFGTLKEELYCCIENGYVIKYVPGNCK